MKELIQILDQARQLSEANRSFALATVVRIGGSTYRRPGARMLVADDGQRWGALSGGCLEGEVALRAMDVIESGKPQLIPFDLADDDIVLGFGTGCDGVVHVLIQPILAGQSPTVIDALNYSIEHRKTSVLATIIADTSANEQHLGKYVIVSEQDAVGPSTLESTRQQLIVPHCQTFLLQEINDPQMYLWHTLSIESQKSETDGRPETDTFEVLFEFVRPPIRLFIFGEGYDVHAVVAQAALMGWEIVIVGRKPVDVLKERFPLASDWLFLMHPEEVGNLVTPDARSAALVMNHTYARDRDLMFYLAGSPIPYIGMLGPRERTKNMLADEHRPAPVESIDTNKLFGPVGLDIGTETPEEIALSAIAEIQAVLHQRNGASLRGRQSPIHSVRTPIDAIE